MYNPRNWRKMLLLHVLILAAFSLNPFLAKAQSGLLESVKRNPKEAKEMCENFIDLNSKGISAHSDEVLNNIAKEKNLTKLDSEILSMYVIGLHCRNVR